MATRTVDQPPVPGATALASTAGELTVRISPVFEREFKRRGVFPELRLEHAEFVSNDVTGYYKLTADRARELLADAGAMRARHRQLLRGIPAAYTALIRIVTESLATKCGAAFGMTPDSTRQ